MKIGSIMGRSLRPPIVRRRKCSCIRASVMKVDKTWTFEEAQRRSEEEEPELLERQQPFVVWMVLNHLDELKEKFDGGDKFALPEAIQKCANHDLVMPDWVADAYVEGYRNIVHAKFRSWDDVFSQAYPGRKLAALRKRRVLGPGVSARIRDILEREPETRIDEALFERVGQKFGIGKMLTAQFYYRWLLPRRSGSGTMRSNRPRKKPKTSAK